MPTPLGTYNPDWTIVIEKDGAERQHFVVETKSFLIDDALWASKKSKIVCGKAHSKALSFGGKQVRYVRAAKLDDLFT